MNPVDKRGSSSVLGAAVLLALSLVPAWMLQYFIYVVLLRLDVEAPFIAGRGHHRRR